jgi:hypothetical protein
MSTESAADTGNLTNLYDAKGNVVTQVDLRYEATRVWWGDRVFRRQTVDGRYIEETNP